MEGGVGNGTIGNSAVLWERGTGGGEGEEREVEENVFWFVQW